jgi:hypothetical protein
VCLAMNCDPAQPGNAEAPLALRLTYERCLLEFEDYLLSGIYESEMRAGRTQAYTLCVCVCPSVKKTGDMSLLLIQVAAVRVCVRVS